MNKNEMAAVMLSDGPWQCRRNDAATGWRDAEHPIWDWMSYEYRVKPKPVEVFVNEYANGSLAVHRDEATAKEAFMAMRKSGSPAVRYVRASDVGIS